MSFDGGYIKRLLYGYLESDQGRWLEVVCVVASCSVAYSYVHTVMEEQAMT